MAIFYNEKASAEFFYLIWSNSPTNQTIYIIASILLITFQTGFIFSEELSEIYLENGTENAKSKSSIMNVNSFFNSLSGFFDIVVISRGVEPSNLIFTIFLFLAVSLMINFCFRRFDLIKGWIRYKKSVRQTNPVILGFAALMMNYDIVFFVLSIMGFSSIPCRWILVNKDLNNNSNYLMDNSFDTTLFLDDERTGPNEQLIPQQVSYLNDHVLCYSNTHLLMIVMGFLLLLSNFMLKRISNKLMGFVPSYKVFACKFGNADLLYDVILIFILFTKTMSFIFFRKNYLVIRLIFVVYFFMLVFSYLIIWRYRPFYNYYQHRLKCFQVLYLLTLTGFSILVRETSFSLIETEISTVIFIMITLSLLLKMNDNMTRIDIQELIKATKKKKFVQKREMLTIYYLIISFVKIKIESGNKDFLTGISRLDDTAFLINYLLEEHKKSCKKVYCYCRKSKVTQIQSSLFYYKDRLEGTIIFEAMYLLDEMLQKVVRANTTYNDNVFFCYINYLLNFMGRPTQAYKLLKQKMSEMTLNRKSKGAIQRVEVSALQFTLEHLALKNLSIGSLSLEAFRDQLGDYSKRASEMKIGKHVLFLNEVERLKVKIKKVSSLRVKFLSNLRSNAVMKKSHKLSVEYFDNRASAYKLYWGLSDACKRKYAPLQLIFGYFVMNCCQDRELASKILINYAKIMVTACNLHKVFWQPEFKDKEFSVVSISAEPKQFHKIQYVSSNIFKWLGFTNEELLQRDLSILIPKPLKKAHRNMIRVENITGKVLMNNQLRNMVCISKDGYQIPITLGVRINVLIENGIQFSGVINFRLKKGETCILMVNKSGKIEEMTELASSYFKKGENLTTYNKSFSSIFRDINQVSKEKLYCKEMGENYSLLIKNKKRMRYWRNYCDWIEGKEINILTKGGKVEEMEIVIDDYLIYSIRDFVRFVIVKKTNRQTFDHFTLYNYKVFSTEKNLKRIFDYIRNEQFKDLHSMGEDSNFNLEDEDYERLYKKSNTRIFETHRGKLVHSNGFFNSSILSNYRESSQDFGEGDSELDEEKSELSEEYLGGSEDRGRDLERPDYFRKSTQRLSWFPSRDTMTRRGYIQKSYERRQIIHESILEVEETFIENDKNEKKKIKSLKFNTKKKKKLEDSTRILDISRNSRKLLKKKTTLTKSKSSNTKDNNGSFQQSSRSKTSGNNSSLSIKIRSDFSKTGKETRMKVGILNVKKLNHGSDNSSSAGSVNASRIKSRVIEKIIKKHFKPDIPTPIFRFSQIFLVLFLVFNILTVYLKDPLQLLTYQDMITQAVNVDVFSWLIWSQVYTNVHLDICRFTESGFMQNDINVNEYEWTLFERCTYVYKQSVVFYTPADSMLEKAIKNLSFPYLYHYDSYAGMSVDLEVYEYDQDNPDVPIWKNITMARRSALSLLQAVGMRMLDRDYENGTGIVPKIGRNRSLDPDEDFLRRNGLSTLNRECAYRSYDFYEYVKAVVLQNEMFILYSSMAAIIFSIVLYFIFILYVAREISWMRDFYKKIFFIEIGDLQKIINVNQKKAVELDTILLEEKVNEHNHDNIFHNKVVLKKGDNISNLRKEKLRINLKGHYFGFLKLSLIFASTLSIVIIAHFAYYLILIPKAKRVTNLVKAYVCSVELWSSYATLHSLFFNVVFWNNTMPAWGTDALTAYNSMKNHIYENVHKNLTEALEMDLGNYSETYVNVMARGNSCETLFSIESEKHKNCHLYYDGAFNSNFLVGLKGIIRVLDFYIGEWQIKRNDWKQIETMWTKKSFRTLLTQMQPILTSIYYKFNLDVTNTLMDELQEELEFVELMTYFMYLILALACLLIYFHVVKRVQKLMRDFKTVVFIFPFELIEKNLILKHHLKRVSKGGHLYKI